MTLARRALAEVFARCRLVFGGCGSAVLAAGFPEVGIGSRLTRQWMMEGKR
jgi:hypothetical protein